MSMRSLMDSYVLESAISVSARHKGHFRRNLWFIFVFWSIFLYNLTGNLDANENIRLRMLYVGNSCGDCQGGLSRNYLILHKICIDPPCCRATFLCRCTGGQFDDVYHPLTRVIWPLRGTYEGFSKKTSSEKKITIRQFFSKSFDLCGQHLLCFVNKLIAMKDLS